MATVHVEVEIASFYPAIATWLTKFVYSNTQSKIHVLVTHGFLRSLARRDLEQSAVGRFEPRGIREEQGRVGHGRRHAAGASSPGSPRRRSPCSWRSRSGCCAMLSPSCSPSASAASRGRDGTWIRRTVPERVRMTSDSVEAPRAPW